MSKSRKVSKYLPFPIVSLLFPQQLADQTHLVCVQILLYADKVSEEEFVVYKFLKIDSRKQLVLSTTVNYLFSSLARLNWVG